jgi:D-glycero-D-manno-heptose 1,7-bisphosphate phosphatase
MVPALFLDRDGVIIENRPNYVRSWADVDMYPQALRALARIRSVPYKIILVTNQSGVGRGMIPRDVADGINTRLATEIEQAGGRIDAVYLCPHAPADHCACRKPRPGMLLQAAQEHDIDLSQSFMIGDALTDIAAGRAAGVKQAILLHSGRGQAQLALPESAEMQPIVTYADLAAALLTIFPA